VAISGARTLHHDGLAKALIDTFLLSRTADCYILDVRKSVVHHFPPDIHLQDIKQGQAMLPYKRDCGNVLLCMAIRIAARLQHEQESSTKSIQHCHSIDFVVCSYQLIT
jgi:hypothetical protein